MRSVMFTFRPGVQLEEQDEILKTINDWKTVSKAGRLKPSAKHPLVLRMAYAYIKDGSDVEQVAEQLSELPEIESASVPTERYLVKRT